MMVRGALRKGEALLVGLTRCGHCGRRLQSAITAQTVISAVIIVMLPGLIRSADPCISFGALRVDQAVGAEIVRVLQPIGVEAAMRAITEHEQQAGEQQHESSWHSSRPDTRRPGRAANMTWSILTIVLSPQNSSGGGMAASRAYALWRTS